MTPEQIDELSLSIAGYAIQVVNENCTGPITAFCRDVPTLQTTLAHRIRTALEEIERQNT